MRISPSCVLACVVAVVACGSDPQGASPGDFDGDGISDGDERRGESLDSDGDGIPDYRDLDSDGDGIPDAVEAGDQDTATPPIDSDGDGMPDQRDTDSDGDGVSDTDELAPNFDVVDTDGDGAPDYRDTDSDGDTLSDRDEGTLGGLGGSAGSLRDTDSDGIPDFRDLDSDNDGVPDACEAGDADSATAPRDTNSDGTPDFRDLDSDGDGVQDGDEDSNHDCKVDPGESSPLLGDTDGDNVPDLVEKVAGTNPNDPTSSIPKTDFYFVLPYQRNRGTGDIEFATDVRQADIFFSMDNTGSMEGETTNIKTNLVSTIVPQISAAIPNSAFGLGRFRDFPLAPHGNTSDRPYDLRQPITASTSTIGTAITALPDPAGGLDIPESGYEALYQWASGAGLPAFGLPPFQSNAPSGIGGAGFRKDSLPIIVHITDAISHVPADYAGAGFAAAAHSRDQVVAAYKAIGGRIVGINSLENAGTAFDPRAQLQDLAIATRAHIAPDASGECPTGIGGASYPAVQVSGVPRCPAVFDVKTDGTGLSTLVVDAIKQLASTGEIDVSTRPIGKTQGERGEVLPLNTTTASFLKSIRPVPPPPAGSTIDGDVFRRVKPGSKVVFRLDAYNDFVPEIESEQLFTIDIQVLGDDVTLLDTRRVFIVVPKKLASSVVK